MKKFVLANTDGFSISTKTYDTLEQAYTAMAGAYHDAYPQENDPSSEEMSFLAKDNAILYRNGEDVLVWDITCVEDARADALVRNLVELLRDSRGDLYDRGIC